MTRPLSGTPIAYVYTTDRDRAVGFYRDTLGFALNSSDGYGDYFQLGGALLRLTVIKDHKPSEHPVLGWQVEDCRATVEALRGKGVTFNIYDGMGQDALGIWTSPDGKSKIAFFNDPDGNALMLNEG
ncbi:MAG: VOC family protein [Caulobacterales bacterium]|nr:VOC family protein [Caulobacterales bacterium]